MANEMITQLPTVTSANLSDIIYAVQGYSSPSSPGTSVQETLQQVFNLMVGQTILNFAGNPNSNVAGQIYQFCYDTTDKYLYVCTSTGSAMTAVWTLVGANLLAPANGGTGVANPTAHTIPVAEGSSNYNYLALSNGQLLIGNTGSDPTPATLTAGTNISIMNSGGAITISSSGSAGFSWNVVTGTSQSMTTNNGYIVNSATLCTLSLPSTSSVGDRVTILGEGAGGWTISQASGQQIHIGSTASTSGTGGSVSSSNQWDTLNMICIVANTIWTTLGAPQSSGLTIV